MQADGAGDVVEFVVADFFELFAPGGEPLVDLDDFLSHHFVSFFGAAHKDEIGAGGQALVAVGIEAEAQHQSFAPRFLLARICHIRRLNGTGQEVKTTGAWGQKRA